MALREEELTSLCDDVDLDRIARSSSGARRAIPQRSETSTPRYYERLLRFCLRRLNDRHEAEDAAQEAFARAWKALPRFAGERRFYPWLTVIAGNICTDMLRRRSRSTPTDDLELTAQHPVGVVGEDTSEELVLAAVDGELVNRALDRLSTRHRHVLAMREGSGWTYQQIADHEGVEIGTIETLLWRARQALKREFAVVSESKEALGRFPHRDRCAHPPHHLPGGAPRCQRAPQQRRRVRGDAQRRHRRRRHRRSRRSRLHRPARTLEWPERRGIGAGIGPRRSAPRPGLRLSSALRMRAARCRGRPALGGPSAGPTVATRTTGAGGGVRHRRTVADAATAAAARDERRRPLLGGAAPGGSSSGAGGAHRRAEQGRGRMNSTVSGATGGLRQTVSGVTRRGRTDRRWRHERCRADRQWRGGRRRTTVSGAAGGVGQTRSGGVTSGVNGITQSIGLGSVLPGPSGSGLLRLAALLAPPRTTTTTNPVQGVIGGTTKTVGGLLGG